MFTNLCLVPLLLFTASLVPKSHFQLTKKKARKKTWKWADIVQFGRWRDLAKSSSPLPGLVLNPLEETLLQPLLKTFIKVFIMIERWKIN